MTRDFIVKLLLVVLLSVYGLFLAYHVRAYAAGADSSGYLNESALFLSGKFHAKQRLIEGISDIDNIELVFTPLGFQPSVNDELTPVYSAGLPILIALTSAITGFAASSHFLMIVHALCSLVLIYKLALTLRLERAWAVIATTLLAINPLFINYSLHLMSDMPSMFWCGLAIFLILKNRILAAGMVAGFLILLRPTNILIFPSLLFLIGWNYRRLTEFVLGGFPMAILWCFINYKFYGHLVATGYGDMSRFFGLEFLPQSIDAYEKYFVLELTPFVLLTAGVFTKSFWENESKTSLLILVWILPFLIFYSFYFFTSETWWYMRFLLPTFPAFILAIVFVVREIYGLSPSFGKAIMIFFLIFSFSWQIHVADLYRVYDQDGEKAYFDSVEFINKNVPDNAVIIAMQNSGSLFCYSEFPILRYDYLSEKDAKKISEFLTKSHRPLYALLHDFERMEALEKKFFGKWVSVGKVGQITIWRRENA